jgi:hypothetical protein
MKALLATTAALALAVGLTVPAPASANLLTNGSFEDTTHFVDNTGQDTMTLPVGSNAMTGWTVAGSESLAWIGPTNPFSLSASNGSYFLDLTGYQEGGPFSGVTQTIATSAGSTYLLSFGLGSSSIYGLPVRITASAAAAVQPFTSSDTGSNNWETETLSFTATGSSTTVSLLGATGESYIGLDNVSVTLVSSPIPEPVSLALLGAGLAGLALVRRRRG